MEDPHSTSSQLEDAFTQHFERILRLCVLLAGSRERGEDIAQETFLRVAPRLAELSPESVRAYLARTAVNLSKNQMRRLYLEQRTEGLRATLFSNQRSIQVEDELALRDEIWRVVKSLPPRQRACLVLRYYEDLTEAETAKVLGCQVGTVKSQTARAIGRVRRVITHED